VIDIIHSVSYDAQENLLDYFPGLAGRGGKCVVIRNGIEVDLFAESAARDLRSELCVGSNVFLIGFLGRFMAPKGFGYLVDAIEILKREFNLPKHPLVLTFGEGGFIREEKQAIIDKGLDRFFRFMPFTPNVAGTIKGLDVVVMPSLWEACPFQPMEALASGTPFIGTDCIGLREVLRATPATVVPKANSMALAKALLKQMEHERKREFKAFMVDAGERFDVRKTRQGLLELYDRMIRH
jgi:glycosyltransferase involved in cell wall biosynthesis